MDVTNSSDRSSYARGVAWIALLDLARAGAALAPGMWVWGLNVERFLDPRLAWATAVAVIAALAPLVAATLTRVLVGLVELVATRRRWSVALALAAAGLAGTLADRTRFTGDYLMRQRTIEDGTFVTWFLQTLPLDWLIHYLIPTVVVNAAPVPIELSGRVLGAIETGILALLAIRFARELQLPRAGGAVAGAIVFWGGYLVVFTGFAKAAEEMCLLTACAGIFGLSMVRSDRSHVALAWTMAAALALHRSAVLLLPAWGCAWLLRQRRHGRTVGRLTPRLWFALLLPLVVLLVMAPVLLELYARYDLPLHLASSQVASEGGGLRSAIRGLHLLDLINLTVALSPLALLAPWFFSRALAAPPRRGELGFLASLTLPFVPTLLFVRPIQGVFRDWDVFAPAGVAFSVATGWVLGHWTARSARLAGLSAALILSAAVPSLQWLVHFHDVDRGLARVEAFATEPPARGSDETLRAWDFLGYRNFSLGRVAAGRVAYARAAAMAPHRYYYLAWALGEIGMNDFGGARGAYQEMLRRFPDDPLGWFGLAGASLQVGDTTGAEAALLRLREAARTRQQIAEIREFRHRYPRVWPEGVALPEWLTAGP